MIGALHKFPEKAWFGRLEALLGELQTADTGDGSIDRVLKTARGMCSTAERLELSDDGGGGNSNSIELFRQAEQLLSKV